MGEKTLYVTDLDGTLLNDNSEVSVQTANILNRAIDEGALVTVATARTPATAAKILKPLHLNLPIAAMTGGTLWNPQTNTYSNIQYFEASTVNEIMEVYRRHGLPTFIYTLSQGMMHIYHSGPVSDLERDFIAQRTPNPYKTFHIPPHGDSQLPHSLDNVILFFAMQPAQKGQPVHQELVELSKTSPFNPIFYFDTVYPGNAMIEAFPPTTSKADAIKRIASLTGATRIVAFGDNRNDLPLFETATESVAVANAIPELKAVADKTIGPNTTDAVARFILEDHRLQL